MAVKESRQSLKLIIDQIIIVPVLCVYVCIGLYVFM